MVAEGAVLLRVSVGRCATEWASSKRGAVVDVTSLTRMLICITDT